MHVNWLFACLVYKDHYHQINRITPAVITTYNLQRPNHDTVHFLQQYFVHQYTAVQEPGPETVKDLVFETPADWN